MDETVRVDRRWAMVVRLDVILATHTLCDILWLYPAIGADRVFPDCICKLWRVYGDDSGGGHGRYDRIKSGRGRYYNSGVFGVENQIPAG